MNNETVNEQFNYSNIKFKLQQHIYRRLQILEHTSSAIFIIQLKSKFQT